jgi:hypothetical protein
VVAAAVLFRVIANVLPIGDSDGFIENRPANLAARSNDAIVRQERCARTQEFALYAAAANHQRTEVVRQQWSFSPDTSRLETEQFVVNLPEVLILELQIDPGRHDNTAVASLEIPWTVLKQVGQGPPASLGTAGGWGLCTLARFR